MSDFLISSTHFFAQNNTVTQNSRGGVIAEGQLAEETKLEQAEPQPIAGTEDSSEAGLDVFV